MGKPNSHQRQQAEQARQAALAASEPQPLISHLIELRTRLLYCVLAAAVPLIPIMVFIKDVYNWVLHPFALSSIPTGTISVINTGVYSPAATPMKMAIILSIIVAAPVIIFQVWRFIAPGLYQGEKRLAMPLLSSSIALFYLGMAFAYFVLAPMVLYFSYFFADWLEQNWQPEISNYVDSMVTQFLAMGVTFETPVATFLLVKMGIVSVSGLKKARPYVLLGALVLGALITPADVASQMTVAIPVYLLYELGILVARLFAVPKPVDDSVAEAESTAEPAAETDTATASD